MPDVAQITLPDGITYDIKDPVARSMGGAVPATAVPLVDSGAGAVGTGTKYAREDHVHPTDTSRQATLVSGTNIKTINGQTILGSGDLTISTPSPATANPLMDGTVSIGSSAKYAREDHVHPSDTSKQDVLVSGTNIKTMNHNSMLGSGNVNAIYFGIVDGTSTATAFTATIADIPSYYDGLTVVLKNGVITSAAGFTIDINGLGAKPVYTNLAAATAETTKFNVNYTMMFIYDSTRIAGGAWLCYNGYDSNTNTIGYQLRTNSAVRTAADKGYRYRLWFTSLDGQKWVPANTSTSTNATASRTANTRTIDPFGEIIYYSTNGTTNQDAALTATTCWEQYTLSLGYSFNNTGSALTLTHPAPVYLRCTPQSGGGVQMDYFTQTLPTTADGKVYIFLGMAYSATNIELFVNHPVYYYSNGEIRLWTNAEGGSSVSPATANPLMDGTAAVGTSAKYAREDHVHPTDTSRQEVLQEGEGIRIARNPDNELEIACKYSPGSGLTLSLNNEFDHSNSITAQPTQALYPIAIDAQGHISSYGSAVTIPDVSGKIDTAGTGLSKSGTTLNHSNAVTAQGAQAVYPITIDAQGHIASYGSAVTISDVAVTQTNVATSTNSAYRVLLSNSANDTTETAGANKTANLIYNPSQASLYIGDPSGEHLTLGKTSLSFQDSSSNIYTLSPAKISSLDGILASQSANKFFASPSGSSGTASFRSIVTADLPSDVVTLTGTQTLSNKTLSAPKISGNIFFDSDGTSDAWIRVIHRENAANNTLSYTRVQGATYIVFIGAASQSNCGAYLVHGTVVKTIASSQMTTITAGSVTGLSIKTTSKAQIYMLRLNSTNIT